MLDGTNYAYNKARMMAFIKSMDENAWSSNLTRWKPPTIDISSVLTPKPKVT